MRDSRIAPEAQPALRPVAIAVLRHHAADSPRLRPSPKSHSAPPPPNQAPEHRAPPSSATGGIPPAAGPGRGRRGGQSALITTITPPGNPGERRNVSGPPASPRVRRQGWRPTGASAREVAWACPESSRYEVRTSFPPRSWPPPSPFPPAARFAQIIAELAQADRRLRRTGREIATPLASAHGYPAHATAPGTGQPGIRSWSAIPSPRANARYVPRLPFRPPVSNCARYGCEIPASAASTAWVSPRLPRQNANGVAAAR